MSGERPKIYLASRYGRRHEMLGHRDTLFVRGYHVTSRWVDGADQKGPDGNPLGTEGETAVEELSDAAQGFAINDLADLAAADWVVCFSEKPGTQGGGRGGRHVEMGYALAIGKRVILIGPKENLFSLLPQVERFDRFGDFCASEGM